MNHKIVPVLKMLMFLFLYSAAVQLCICLQIADINKISRIIIEQLQHVYRYSLSSDMYHRTAQEGLTLQVNYCHSTKATWSGS